MIKVLFVDNDMITRVALKSIIDWDNTEFKIVDIVSDGEKALEIVKEQDVQIVVTDIKMPNVDGIELSKMLYERNYNGQVIILTNHDEFEFVRKAMQYGASDYLLKSDFTPELLLQSLRNVKKKLPINKRYKSIHNELFCNDKIYNMIYGEDTVLDIENSEFSYEYTAVYIFKKDIFNDNSAEVIEDNVSKEIFASLINECMSNIEKVVVPLTSMDLVVFFKQIDIDKFVQNEIVKIKNAMYMYMNTDVGFVQSSPFLLKEQMRRSLRKSVNASKISLYYGFGILFKQNDFDKFVNELDRVFYEKIIYICRQVLLSNYYDAINEVNFVFNSIIVNKIKLCDTKKFIKKLFESLALSCKFYFENDSEIMQNFYNHYDKSKTIDDYKKTIKHIIGQIKKSNFKNKDRHYRYEIEKIIDYIKDNFDRRISLSELANFVNLTESYISKLFKNETGLNIMAYINMLKMEKAMYYLLDTDVLVKEVADKLGYEEQSYFNRIFNKYFGHNPSQARGKFINLYKS